KSLQLNQKSLSEDDSKPIIKKATLLTLFAGLVLSASVFAQPTTVGTTTYTGNVSGGSSPSTGITVNVVSNNSYAIIVTAFGYSCGSTNPTELWYSTTSTSGATGAIATPNWTLLSTVSSPTTTTTTVINDNFFSGLNLTIPANTTYRFAVLVTPSSI